MKDNMMNYCYECDMDTHYELRNVDKTRNIKGKKYTYTTVKAFCKECGEQVNVKGLIDKDNEIFDQFYREKESIISKEEIKEILDKYNIGALPLSRALGFGDITITRYLDKQIPSKKYSDILYSVLNNPKEMKRLLDENREAVGDPAYLKANKQIMDLEYINIEKPKIYMISDYIIHVVEDVTPLALQKILYYMQGINCAVNKKLLFDMECYAWPHGPVYEDVYHKYKEYRYNPIKPNTRFNMEMFNEEISEKEKIVIDMVINTFGSYSGKFLENITHKETPWIIARGDARVDEHIDTIITNESICEYFCDMNDIYDFSKQDGVIKYIMSLK